LLFGGVVPIIMVTLTGYRFIGSRTGLGNIPGPFAFPDGREIEGGFQVAIPLLARMREVGHPAKVK